MWVLLLFLGAAACAGPSPGRPQQPPLPAGSPPVAAEQPSAATLPRIEFTIQVGAFSTSERAARYALTLKDQGMDAYYFIDDDKLYKVRFERFADKDSAVRRARGLQAAGRIDKFYIVQPAPDIHRIDARENLETRIVETARRFIGTRYRWGGSSRHSGFDCSGLTMTVYRLNGLELPRSSRSQYQAGTRIGRENLRKGDLVFFATRGRGRVSHVGIYAGHDLFIHAPGAGKPIRLASLDNGYFRSRFLGARRYF